jgi:hypothetical protein
LFFALRRVGGVRCGLIRHHNHHGQRRSVFESLGPRVHRNTAMALSAVFLTLLFVASVQMLFLATNGVQFAVAAMLLHAMFLCKASHRLLALA